MPRLYIKHLLLLTVFVLPGLLSCGIDEKDIAEKKWMEREDSLNIIRKYKDYNRNKFFQVPETTINIIDSEEDRRLPVSKELFSSADFYDIKFSELDHREETEKRFFSCENCHSGDSEVQGLDDFYIPGRDTNDTLRRIGFWLIAFSLVSVFIHGGIRIIFFVKRKKS